MADHIKNCRTEDALLLIDKLHNSSVDMLRFSEELTQHFRDLMIVKAVKGENKPIVCSATKLKLLENQALNFDIKEIMSILSILQSTAAGMQSGNRRCEMEMAIIRLCNPEIRQDLNSLERRIAILESKKGEPLPQDTKPENHNTEVDSGISATVENKATENTEVNAADNTPYNSKAETANDITPVTQWNEIILVLQKNCPIIAGVLQNSSAYIQGDRLLIDTKNSQFRTLVNGANPVYRDSIRKAAHSVLGRIYKLGPYHAANASANTQGDPLESFAQKLKQLQND